VRTWPALGVGRLTGIAPDGPDLLQAALADFAVAAIAEHSPDAWQVFFDSPLERDRARTDLRRLFPELTFDPLDVADQDWVARSQADLRAVRVGNIVVAPPWDVPLARDLPLDRGSDLRPPIGDTPIVIIIRPSMGFGTAHHATTRLCLGALQRLDVSGRTVIDVGTGSGVLAIAARTLGAIAVIAIDDDRDALQAARENLSLNGDVSVTLREVDARSTGLQPCDIVVANLTGALLAAAAASLAALVNSGGFLILSGLLDHEETSVVAAFEGCVVHHRSQEGEWLCLVLQRP